MKKKLITTSLIAALFAVPAMATQDEIAQKTVTSKYYVDTTKQDKITTDKVFYVVNPKDDENVYVPALVITNAAGTALNGNTIGVVDLGSSSIDPLTFKSRTAATYDNFVPWQLN